jgi:hypothetical protein
LHGAKKIYEKNMLLAKSHVLTGESGEIPRNIKNKGKKGQLLISELAA